MFFRHKCFVGVDILNEYIRVKVSILHKAYIIFILVSIQSKFFTNIHFTQVACIVIFHTAQVIGNNFVTATTFPP